MADEDQDFHIESADAGASDVIPCEAGSIKKGGCVNYRFNLIVIMLTNACISTSLRGISTRISHHL